ncbi:MAG: type IV secretion protein Rhs [Opitutaceae bacterium]|nr:type IV secretion protein Rhs [Opitutaceae bacterium]
MLRRLTSSETRTSGILSAKTTITYSTSNNIVTATRTDQVDSAGLASTTTTKFYKENHTDSFLRNQLYSTTTSAGLRQSYARKRGTWNDSTKTFSAGDSGLASRIVLIEGASASLSGATEYSSHQSVSIDKLWLIPGKSTTATTIRDPFARIARTESHVWTGSAWQLIGWTNYTYNYSHQLTRRETHNGDIYEATYTNGLLASERDAQGVTTQFTYDVNGRLATRTRIHANAASLVTTFTCDAANRIVREEISSPGTTEKLVTTHAYDNAGRLISHTPPGLAATTFAHNPSSRSTTATFPHGGTKTETLTRDGRVDSVTGSAVVPEYYAYAIQSDGRLITRQSIATSSSSRYIRTWTDWLGRAVHIETPPPPGQSAVIAEDHTYNARGLLTKIARSGGFAPILYEYDTIGNLLRSGLDLNANGILDIAGTDRITETDTQIALRSGSTALWDITSRDYTYPVAGNSTRIQTRLSARNLYGATNTLLSSLEQTGSSPLIESTVVPDRANQKLTTTRKQATATQTEILLANQNLTVTTPDGRQFKTENDTLGRPVHSIDPRTGTTTTAYTSGTALVSSVTDPAGYANAFGYDTSGREIWRRDQQNNYARFAYNQRGQITRQWGQAIRPAEFAYNTYGERTTLSSWRNGSNWTASAWDATGATADKITWTFHDATGLLTKKTDAAGKSVDYTYNAQGQVATRLWSRTLSSGARVTATYGYNALTGELLSTASNDGTPTVSRILNRIGLPTTITDATGARTLAWESAAPWQLKTETLPAFYQSRVFTPLYGASGTPLQGETTGWQLGTAASTPANLLSQNYTFNTAGRATGLSSARGANAPGGAATQAFTYAWLANSSLIQTIAATGTSFTQTHTYEAKRNLLTGIIGKWSTATRSAFTYTYDTRGLRASVVQNGDAFDLASAYGNSVRQNFGYNSFREVTSATSYLGTTASTTAQLPGRDFRYTYDPAGNRRTANRHGTDSAQQEDFSVNALNQTTTRENLTAPLDGFSTAATVTVDGGTADKNGNFWQREVTLANSTAPAARQIPVVAGGTTIQKLAFLGPITETLTYDADGNLTGDWRWTYQYDAENRLIAAETKSWAIIANAPLAQRLEFKYDYMGRRVSKIVREKATATAAWTLKSETRFLYDGWNLVAETNASGAILRSYVWGLDLAASPTATGGVGALLQITDHTVSSPQRYFPTYDGNGNIATLVRAADGVLSAVYEYSPFGELLRATGTFADANPFRFSTKYTDTETGLIYYGNRFYDARNGRFINRDPIEERGGFNLYGFCENDSVNQIDYLGYTGTDPDGPCGRWYEDSLILPTVNVTATPLPQFDLSSFLPTSIYQSTGGSVVASGKSSTSSTSSSGSKSSNSKQQIRVPLRGVGFPSGMPSVSSIISQQMQNGLSPGSMLGNLLRHVPFLGGTLGALGDVVSGVGNVTIGIVSFGQSETFGRGIEQVVFGVSVFAADIGAAAYGFSIGKITSVALGVGNLLTGNYFAANYQNDPNPESRGFFSGVSNFVRSVVIPTYGFNLGVNYGGVQQGFVSSEFARSFNQLDAVSYQHDRDQRNRDWVRSSSSSQGEGIPTGPVGAIINIIGAPVFWLTPSR